MASAAPPPSHVFGGVVICDAHCKLFDALSGGALKRFLWFSNVPKASRVSIEATEEEDLDDEEERVDDILRHLCNSSYIYANEVLMENRYDSANGIYLAVYGALFMVLDGVLTGGARLVLAFGRDKTGIQVASDVFENGFPAEFALNYGAHFSTPELLAQARRGFGGMACTNIVTSFSSLPWRRHLPRVRDFLKAARLNRLGLWGGPEYSCSYDIAEVNRLRSACVSRCAALRELSQRHHQQQQRVSKRKRVHTFN